MISDTSSNNSVFLKAVVHIYDLPILSKIHYSFLLKFSHVASSFAICRLSHIVKVIIFLNYVESIYLRSKNVHVHNWY